MTPGGDLTPCPVSDIATHNLTERTLREGLEGDLFSRIRASEHLLEVEGAPCAMFAHPDEVERAYREGLKVPDIVRMRLMLAMAEEYDVTGRIGEIKLPTLVCVGSEDMLADGSERLAKALPNARFKKSEGSGHMINIEAPMFIQKEVTEFLNKAILTS